MAVKPESEMDDETIVKHMNFRHMPIAGMTELPTDKPGWTSEILTTWRAYHNYEHRDTSPFHPNHSHSEG